jgi:hypothetical protein
MVTNIYVNGTTYRCTEALHTSWRFLKLLDPTDSIPKGRTFGVIWNNDNALDGPIGRFITRKGSILTVEGSKAMIVRIWLKQR